MKHLPFLYTRAAIALALFLTSAAGSLAAAQTEPSDREMRAAIERRLALAAALPSHLLDVEVKGGIVTLAGSVNHLLARDRASELAQTIRGVRAVVNTITVNPITRADDDITIDAKLALAGDPATDLYQTGVQVRNGTAILTGNVDSLTERQLAAEVVKGVKGVREIKNDLVVKPKSKRSDKEIEADIRGVLKQNPWVDVASIDVNVKDGAAFLKGTVGSSIERTYAITDAWVAGVTRLDAEGLTVRPGSTLKRTTQPVSDKEIKRLVETALTRHPRLASFKPEVESKNHIVTLAGVVDNFAAKKAAEEIAESTTGVTQVEKHIKVRPKKIPDDAALVKEVRAALLRDPYVSRFDLNVSADNALVLLDGRVDSTFEKNYAEFVAARVRGVVDVRNNLKVVELEVPRKTDWAVEREIEHGLRWSPFVESKSISVSVKDGIAVLSGSTASWQEKTVATKIAQRAGAESVLNQLQVKEQTAS